MRYASSRVTVRPRRICWRRASTTPSSPSADLTNKIVANIKAFRAHDDDRGMRIVNSRQFDRLVSLIESTTGSVVAGGGFERSSLTIEPTVILDPSPDDAVMGDEIFGPVLPVITIESTTAAVDFVNRRPKPLALYVFTASRQLARSVVDEIPSGGAVVNHSAMHCLVPQWAPITDVGASKRWAIAERCCRSRPDRIRCSSIRRTPNVH
jgi:aldehyde dehydrogenase (NAD+)